MNNKKCIYIITNSILEKNDIFKIGRHTGNETTLLKRYNTYLIDSILLRLKYCENVNQHEKIIKTIFSDYLIRNSKNNKSEWVKIPQKELIFRFDKYFKNINRL